MRNPIDAFILARLDQEGLKPSPEADRATLLRRVSLDLVGLPPTPEEVDAFVADRSPDAYEKQVDRLLASPHYGERWARRWLDLARYADTNGYEKDRRRSIWPYRDWVIKALNANLPFDRFTIEQLAGDMLPGAGVSQKVATGFHRNTMLNEEGGIDPLEFRFYAMTDRVATTGTVWLGLTIGCAQCHTHKFDPIPHRDYYQFMALLNNADEPKMPVPVGRERRAPACDRSPHRRAEGRLAESVSARRERRRSTEQTKADDARVAGRSAAARTSSKTVSGMAAQRLGRGRALDGAQAEEGELEPAAALDRGRRLGVCQRRPEQARCLHRAAQLGARGDHGDPARGASRRPAAESRARAGFLRGAIRRFLPERDPAVGRTASRCRSRRRRRATRRRRKDAAAAIDGDPQTGWSINGGQGHEQAAVFRLATPLESAGEITVEMVFERYYAAGLGRFRISATTDPRADHGEGDSVRARADLAAWPKASGSPSRSTGCVNTT